jgi:hypothetical protein
VTCAHNCSHRRSKRATNHQLIESDAALMPHDLMPPHSHIPYGHIFSASPHHAVHARPHGYISHGHIVTALLDHARLCMATHRVATFQRMATLTDGCTCGAAFRRDGALWSRCCTINDVFRTWPTEEWCASRARVRCSPWNSAPRRTPTDPHTVTRGRTLRGVVEQQLHLCDWLLL